MPFPSSSGSNFQKVHPPQFVEVQRKEADEVEVERQEEDEVDSNLSFSEGEEDLHCAVVEVEGQEEDDVESKKSPSILSDVESMKPSEDSSDAMEGVKTRNPSSEPEDDVESTKPSSISSDVESQKPSEDSSDAMDVVEMRNPSSEPEDVQGVESEKEDKRMDGVEQRKPSSEFEKACCAVGVESMKEKNDGHPITGFDSMNLSDSREGAEANDRNTSDLSQEGEEPTGGVQGGRKISQDNEKRPSLEDQEAPSEEEWVRVQEGRDPSLQDKKRLFLAESVDDAMETSDLSEDDDEPTVYTKEASPMVDVELNKRSDSAEDDDENTVASEEDDPMVSVKLNKISSNSNSDVEVGTAFEPRRSSRNAAAKNKSYPNVSLFLKHINGKRKRAFQKAAVVEVRASNYFYPINA